MRTETQKLLALALSWATLGAVIQQSDAAAFAYASSMHYTRAGHTATLLPNGKVLVAGG